MAYSKIRQPKLSDAIEQQLESLILEGTLQPRRKTAPPERELAKQFDVSRPSLTRGDPDAWKRRGDCCAVRAAAPSYSSSLWQSLSDPLVEPALLTILNPSLTCWRRATRWKALRPTTLRCAARMKTSTRIRELPRQAIEQAQDSPAIWTAEADAVTAVSDRCHRSRPQCGAAALC